MQTVHVIDSHTEGEPTRVVLDGCPDLGPGDAARRCAVFRERFDWFRSAVCCEPRGFDAMVGALLLPPSDPRYVAQVIYFNNVGTLGMCVHGTIGVAETLRHLGRIGPGVHRLETPVGDVSIELGPAGVAVTNVESRRHAHGIRIETARHGSVTGDVAWGGNWFFLCDDHGRAIEPARIGELTALAADVRESLARAGVTGADGGVIDHVELFGAPSAPGAHSRNFVLCPGSEYDRSPCGTGTSAKLACLAAAGKLAEGDTWVQESIVGTTFSGTIRRTEHGVIPTITGRAWITGEARLLLDDDDPFRHGLVK